MGIAPENQRVDAYDRFRDQAGRFFDAQLERLGLSEGQISNQGITELEDSLIRVDDALRVPESFGVLRLSMSADTSVFLVKSNSDAHIEVGVVPFLLERKKSIIERLRLLRSQRPINTLTELIESLSDTALRERLKTEFQANRQSASANARSGNVRTNRAFIAMAMDPQDPQLEDILDAIKEGAKRCGIDADRIDGSPSNDPITPRMLKAIEESEFVIVDLTKLRSNVFYEAGYAQGLGKTPIYVAPKGSEIPFDVKDYPVIQYPNMRELKNLLAERLVTLQTARDTAKGT